MPGATHLKDLNNANYQHTKLINDFQAQKLMRVGLYQQAADNQKPITDAIAKSSEEIKEVLENNKPLASAIVPSTAATSSYSITPLVFPSVSVSYGLIKTAEELVFPKQHVKCYLWRLNSDSRSNIGKWVLFDQNGTEYIWDYKFDTPEIVLTRGLKEILFNGVREDVESWKTLTKNSGLGSTYKQTTLYSTLKSVGYDGKGFKQSAKPIIIIPKDPEELCKNLELQLQAQAAGHKNTFNHVNAILKELLYQKHINSKDYREFLRKHYHV